MPEDFLTTFLGGSTETPGSVADPEPQGDFLTRFLSPPPEEMRHAQRRQKVEQIANEELGKVGNTLYGTEALVNAAQEPWLKKMHTQALGERLTQEMPDLTPDQRTSAMEAMGKAVPQAAWQNAANLAVEAERAKRAEGSIQQYGEKVASKFPFLREIPKFSQSLSLIRAANNVEAGKADAFDARALAKHKVDLEEAAARGQGGKVVEAVTEMPAAVAEWMMLGGAGGVGKSLGEGLAVKALGRTAFMAAEKVAPGTADLLGMSALSTAEKLGIGAAGVAGSAAARTAVDPSLLVGQAAGIEQGQSAGGALLRSVRDKAISNVVFEATGAFDRRASEALWKRVGEGWVRGMTANEAAGAFQALGSMDPKKVGPIGQWAGRVATLPPGPEREAAWQDLVAQAAAMGGAEAFLGFRQATHDGADQIRASGRLDPEAFHQAVTDVADTLQELQNPPTSEPTSAEIARAPAGWTRPTGQVNRGPLPGAQGPEVAPPEAGGGAAGAAAGATGDTGNAAGANAPGGGGAPAGQPKPAPAKTAAPGKSPTADALDVAEMARQYERHRQEFVNDGGQEAAWHGGEIRHHFTDYLKAHPELADRDAHGIADSGKQALEQLTNLLDKGIDPSRPFHTIQVGGRGQSQMADRVSDPASFIVLGRSGKSLKEGGIHTVVVNGGWEDALPGLRQRYPDVQFVAASGKEPAPVAKPAPAAPGAAKEPLQEYDLSHLRDMAKMLNLEAKNFPKSRDALIRHIRKNGDPRLLAQMLGEEPTGPPAAPPPAPLTPPENAGTESSLPDYMRENARVITEHAKKTGLADKIEELAAQRKTAKETAKALGVDEDIVINVRLGLGIPSRMGEPADFEAWLQKRQAAKPPEAPPGPAAPKPPEPVQGPSEPSPAEEALRVARLTAKQADAVRRYYLGGESLEDIADGATRQAAAAAKAKGLLKLRNSPEALDLLKKAGHGPDVVEEEVADAHSHRADNLASQEEIRQQFEGTPEEARQTARGAKRKLAKLDAADKEAAGLHREVNEITKTFMKESLRGTLTEENRAALNGRLAEISKRLDEIHNPPRGSAAATEGAAPEARGRAGPAGGAESAGTAEPRADAGQPGAGEPAGAGADAAGGAGGGGVGQPEIIERHRKGRVWYSADGGKTWGVSKESALLTAPGARDFGKPLTEAERQGSPAGGQEAPGAEPARPLRETALANAVVDKQAVAEGRTPQMRMARLANTEAWDAGMAKMDADPRAAERLVEDLSNSKRPPSKEEIPLLLHRRIALHNEHERVMREYARAFQDPQKSALSAIDLQTMEAREADLGKQKEQLEALLNRAGNEAAWTLQFRRQMAKEDFSLSSMLARATVAKGEALTPEEKVQITELQAKIDALQQKLDAATAGGNKIMSPAWVSGEKVRVAVEGAKDDFQKITDRWKYNRLPQKDKVLDFIRNLRVLEVISSPAILLKLAATSAWRLGITPVEQAVGAGISQMGGVPGQIAAKAPSQGGASLSIEGTAAASFFVEGFKDAWQTMKTGKSDLDVAYGDKRADVEGEGKLARAQHWLSYVYRLHAALKAPAVRAEFTRSLLQRAENGVAAGQDVTSPGAQLKMSVEAYVDAQRAKFQQENWLVDTVNKALTPGKDASGFEKGVKYTGQLLLPVRRIPTNIVAETANYLFGSVSGTAKAALAYRRGLETLKPAEADAIMRAWKKGSLGLGLALLGYFKPDLFGGYYREDEKKKEGEVPYGGARIAGVDVPSWAMHHPLLQVPQFFATVRQTQDKITGPRGHREEQGLTQGLFSGLFGLAEEVPVVRETYDLGKLGNPRERGYYFGQLAKSFAIPSFVSWIAKRTDTEGDNPLADPQKRKTVGVLEQLQEGIPGLRRTLPTR